MKKNGFTLAELIVTIALLGLVGIVLSMNMIKIINNQKEEKKEEFVELMEEAACAYVILSDANWNGTYVQGNILVSEGIIDEEVNGYKSANYDIEVNIVDGKRSCKLIGDVE